MMKRTLVLSNMVPSPAHQESEASFLFNLLPFCIFTVITFMTSPDMNVILKGAVASSVIFISATTTAALHWFVSPCIHKLKWKPGSDTFEVEMMSWLATFISKTIKFADIRPPETNRPFVTFKADGNFYFVDTEHCHNKVLLAKLTPQKPAYESAFKKS